jgi:hypothetical protein
MSTPVADQAPFDKIIIQYPQNRERDLVARITTTQGKEAAAFTYTKTNSGIA